MRSIMTSLFAGTALSTSCVLARSLSCRGTQKYRNRLRGASNRRLTSGRLRPLRTGKQIGTHTIVLADVRQRKRAGGGGGPVGPFKTLFDAHLSRGRVSEWPVTDPILRYWYCLKITRRPSQLPECVRRSGAGAGRFDRTRPAAKHPLSAQSRPRTMLLGSGGGLVDPA